jgi:DNA ligase-1
VTVVLMAFDLLLINGRSLLPLPLARRRALLRAAFNETPGRFEFARGSDHVEDGDTAPIEAALQEACGGSCEGLMVKTLGDTYEPSKRSLHWLKLKKDYIEGLGVCDSVDLVLLGGYLGRGKRTGWYGAFLMGCYDPDRDEYQSCCKVGTGFSEEDLARLTEAAQPLILERKPHNVNTGDPLTPDHWFTPQLVWELQAADLSKSSVHRAAVGKLGDNGRGVGLRFPRFLRERPDKKAEHATSAEQIAEMYFSQAETTHEALAGEEDQDDIL